MSRVDALPFADTLWVQWRTDPPVAMRHTRVSTRRLALDWCRLDESGGSLEAGYYLVRRSASDGWLYRIEPEHPSRRMDWRGRDPELVGEVAVSDSAEEARHGYDAHLRSLRQLGLDDGAAPAP